jgi:hypothetical protein
MPDLMSVTPVEGRRVRDPGTMRLIEPGHLVNPEDPYWWRRLRDGDIQEIPAGPESLPDLVADPNAPALQAPEPAKPSKKSGPQE